MEPSIFVCGSNSYGVHVGIEFQDVVNKVALHTKHLPFWNGKFSRASNNLVTSENKAYSSPTSIFSDQSYLISVPSIERMEMLSLSI